MRTTEISKKGPAGEAIDQYLGFTIHTLSGWFLALPGDWPGEILDAATLPEIRRKIWRWWYQPSF